MEYYVDIEITKKLNAESENINHMNNKDKLKEENTQFFKHILC